MRTNAFSRGPIGSRSPSAVLVSALALVTPLVFGTTLPAEIVMTVDIPVTIPVNIAPLVDDNDFVTVQDSLPHDADGLELTWNFVTTDGVMSQVVMTPTSSGSYDWLSADSAGNGMYKIEMPATGGSPNNDTEGFGWFTGKADDVAPWRGPTITFVSANIANSTVNGSDKLEVDVVQFGGASGSFASGVPAVNATHVAGTAQTANDLGEINVTNLNTLSSHDPGETIMGATDLGTGSGLTSLAGASSLTSARDYIVARLAWKYSGTSTDSGTTNLITDTGVTGIPDDGLLGALIEVRDTSTGRVHAAIINDFDEAGRAWTFSPNSPFSIAFGDTYRIFTKDAQVNQLAAGVTLANDAITADKFDQTSAHPLESADSGNSEILRKGSESVTGTSIEGKIDTVASVVDGIASAVATVDGIVDAIFAFLDGAPTFGEAMDGHQYTSARALKLDNLDMAVSDLPSRSPGLLVTATIDDSSIAVTQTSFALSVGPPDDDALNGALVIVTADTDSSKKAVGLVKDYDGMTRTLTLVTDPEVFTFADGDQVDVIATGEPAALWLGSTP